MHIPDTGLPLGAVSSVIGPLFIHGPPSPPRSLVLSLLSLLSFAVLALFAFACPPTAIGRLVLGSDRHHTVASTRRRRVVRGRQTLLHIPTLVL